MTPDERREHLTQRAEDHLRKAGAATRADVRKTHLGMAEALFLAAQGATPEDVAARLGGDAATAFRGFSMSASPR